MARCRFGVGFLVVAIVAGAAAGRPPKRASSPHSPGWHFNQVTSIALSPDGKWVAASYFGGGYNRIGDDWRAFVAEWEVDGKTQTIVPDAYSPVAFSPDSKALAMGIYKRKGHERSPRVRLAVWGVGKPSLRCILPGQETPVSPTIGAAWSPDGKRLAMGSSPDSAMQWGSDYKLLSVDISAKTPRNAWLNSLAPKGAEPVVVKNLRLTKLIAPRDHVRISGDGKLIAIGQRGKSVLRTSLGKLVKTFPAGGGAVAFSADSKRLAAADSRAIIRVWDIASGKLIRTMRLDGHDKENTVMTAAIQCTSKFGDPAGNRKRIASLVTRAAQKGAKIVVLPETAVTGYMTSDIKTAWQVPGREISDDLEGVDPKDVAETVPGPSTKLFAPLAEKYGIYLTVPILEVDRKTGRYYNTSVLLGPEGRILIHYRKRNPWIWAEKGWAEEGNLGNPVVDTPFGRLGLLICFDVHDQFKVMSELKIDTLLYSIAWVDDAGSDWFSVQLPARTKDCGFNVIGANWTVPKNPKPAWHGYGKSLIISSKGKVLGKVKSDLAEETVYAEIPIPAK